MILKNFVVDNRINSRLKFNGIDDYPLCFSKKHFKTFPWPVEYQYNSRGFRDQEWPEDLDDLKNRVIWCIGDSFTLGIGSPLAHTWPKKVESVTGLRAINVSRDGASNEWIADRAVELIQELDPKYIAIMWSFVHRRQRQNTQQIHYERSTAEQDLDNFVHCLSRVSGISNHRVLHTMVPRAAPDNHVDYCNKLLAQQSYHIPMVKPMDLSRDGFHFDQVTSDWLAGEIDRILLHD